MWPQPRVLSAAENIAGVETIKLNYKMMPRATYSHPQVASFGYTEAEAKEQGYEVKVGRFPFQPNGKALGLGDYAGFVKIITDAKYGEILGAHMVGPDVSELLPELTLAQRMELTTAEIARNVHAHPTLSVKCHGSGGRCGRPRHSHLAGIKKWAVHQHRPLFRSDTKVFAAPDPLFRGMDMVLCLENQAAGFPVSGLAVARPMLMRMGMPAIFTAQYVRMLVQVALQRHLQLLQLADIARQRVVRHSSRPERLPSAPGGSSGR